MFDKLGKMAEQAATSVSRRQFLRRLGGATTLATTLGALLAQPALDRRLRLCGYASQIGCQGQPVGAQCGAERVGNKLYRYYCTPFSDLGGGLYSCACGSK
jgi:hypothetical protein